MNSLNELINLLATEENILRFKELEKAIDRNKELKQEFEYMLHLQKVMVQKEHNKDNSFDIAEEEYTKQRTKIMDFYIINEYLDLLDLINNDLNMIQSIIESEISIDFD